MRRFQLGGFVWQLDGGELSFRKQWWSYYAGCVGAIIVLGIAVALAAAFIIDPSTTVGGGRRSPPRKVIEWSQQTNAQRAGLLIGETLLLVPMFVLPIAFLIFGSGGQRTPLVFSKTADQIRRGKKVLARMSSIKEIAVVSCPPARRQMAAAQLFVRFSCEPWSMQIDSPSRSADSIAIVLADFCSVPVVEEKLPGSPGSFKPDARGFPVVLQQISKNSD